VDAILLRFIPPRMATLYWVASGYSDLTMQITAYDTGRSDIDGLIREHGP